MKSEPDVYGIEDLERDGTAEWEGVRNYQARNIMRDDMRVGDRVLFYHSNAKPSGVAGLARVARRAYPDFTAWDPKHKYYDPKTNKDEPRWMMVDVSFEEAFDDVVSLAELKDIDALSNMMVTQKGSRLSIQPVTRAEYQLVTRLGRAKPPPAPKAKKATKAKPKAKAKKTTKPRATPKKTTKPKAAPKKTTKAKKATKAKAKPKARR